MKEFFAPTKENREIYNRKTFYEMQERDRTEKARRINQFRLDLVHRYTGESDRVLDIGIGAGTFLKMHGNCLGYDINPYAVKRLKRWGLWFDPYAGDFDAENIAAVTFFDSMEHIVHPAAILDRLTNQVVIVSIPIFFNRQHMMNSKHFKPGEHVWHFTKAQFGDYVWGSGFRVEAEMADETLLGRTDIKTFVLKKAPRAQLVDWN